MKAAPAIALLIVGAAVCGGLLEFLAPDSGRQTMELDQFIAMVGAWFLDKFVGLARIMGKR